MSPESRAPGPDDPHRMSWPALVALIAGSTAVAAAGGAAVAAYLGVSPVIGAVFCGGFDLVVFSLLLLGDRLFGWDVRRTRRPRP